MPLGQRKERRRSSTDAAISCGRKRLITVSRGPCAPLMPGVRRLIEDRNRDGQMRPIVTIHAGEYLVATEIERAFPQLQIWIPSKDTGVGSLST
jgi:hypothetical protein